MKTINLIELLKRCKKGDKEALGLLYTTYSRRMMRVICHYIPDLDAAQDILHDGFLIIFSRINQLRNAEKLEYWMGTIMKNLALQYLKEQDFIQLLTEEYDTPDIPDFEESITIEEMEIMINRLPVGYQKVFRLAVLENKTHKEIAKLLGISAQTSGSQLFHARNMLREMIVKYKTEKGMAILAIIIIAMIFQHNQNDHKVQTISEPTKLRTEKNKDIENKVEQNEESKETIEYKKIEFSKKLHHMYAMELFITGSDQDFLDAEEFFSLSQEQTFRTQEEVVEAACVCARAARLQGNISIFFKNVVKLMAVGSCSEVCCELGEYYFLLGDIAEAYLWFYNAAFETESVLDIHTSQELPRKRLLEICKKNKQWEEAAEWEKQIQEFTNAKVADY